MRLACVLHERSIGQNQYFQLLMGFEIVALALGGLGAGLQYAAQMDAANTQSTIATLNAQAGVAQATQQGNITSLQAQLQQEQAKTAQRAAFENAEAMRQEADLETKIGLENTRRQRDEFRRGLAQAIAQQGGSGATLMTGSPLDLLIAAADEEQQIELDNLYGINAARTKGFREAAGVELGGRVEGLNATLYGLDSMAALAQGRAQASQARIDGLLGQSKASGMRLGAFGNLIGNSAGLAKDYAKIRKYGS